MDRKHTFVSILLRLLTCSFPLSDSSIVIHPQHADLIAAVRLHVNSNPAEFVVAGAVAEPIAEVTAITTTPTSSSFFDLAAAGRLLSEVFSAVMENPIARAIALSLAVILGLSGCVALFGPLVRFLARVMLGLGTLEGATPATRVVDRIAQPGEVALQVERVLQKLKEQYDRVGSDAFSATAVTKELKEIFDTLGRLEGEVGTMKDRVGGILARFV